MVRAGAACRRSGQASLKIQPIVLVLDDDPAVLSALKDSLESNSRFQLLVAQSYSVASEIIMLSPVDVIVADVLLAGAATGIDLCYEAMKRYPKVALVLISADVESNFQSYPVRAVCLHKPFGASDLLDAIAKARVAVALLLPQSG